MGTQNKKKERDVAVANLWLPPIHRLGQLQWIPENAQRRCDTRDICARTDRFGRMPERETWGGNFIVPGNWTVLGVQPGGTRGTATAEPEKANGDDCAVRQTTFHRGQRQVERRRKSGCGRGWFGRKPNTRFIRRAGVGSGRCSGQEAQLQDEFQDRSLFARIYPLSGRGLADVSHFDIGGQK